MTRFIRAFAEHSPTEVGEEITLPDKEAIHLSRVLRLQNGDSLELLDGKGGSFPSVCLESNRSKVTVRVLKLVHDSPNPCSIRMAVALGKGNKWEELIRPLTELGVARLTPLITERTEGAFTMAKLDEKKERWIKITREACKQSGNPWMPNLEDPIPFTNKVTQVEEGEDCWMGSLRDDSIPLSPKYGVSSLSIFIGPEGGWSEEEEESARVQGFSFFTLGTHALRVETAAISALAVARQCMLC